MSACRSCGASVLWVETEATEKRKSRRMPVDADENGRALTVANGNLVIVGRSGNGNPIVRYVKNGKHLSHFATCAHADEHRKKR